MKLKDEVDDTNHFEALRARHKAPNGRASALARVAKRIHTQYVGVEDELTLVAELLSRPARVAVNSANAHPRRRACFV
ncbi:hypothetical protein AWB71_01810 [Caballeronia peredens]|nr:hypothetical protein AWB71_01810 [Caballeronia peredens]